MSEDEFSLNERLRLMSSTMLNMNSSLFFPSLNFSYHVERAFVASQH